MLVQLQLLLSLTVHYTLHLHIQLIIQFIQMILVYLIKVDQLTHHIIILYLTLVQLLQFIRYL
jgi:hypothetical protein